MAQRLGTIFVAAVIAAGALLVPTPGVTRDAHADDGVAAARPAAAPALGKVATDLTTEVATEVAGEEPSAFESALQAAATPAKTKKGTVAIRVWYQRLRIYLPIREAPKKGAYSERIAYHHRTSGWPGSGRSTYIFGHARSGTFLKLWAARKGDVIYLTLRNGHRVKYKVYAKVKVAWYNRTYIYKRREILALQTCLGRNPKGPRLIILAKPVK